MIERFFKIIVHEEVTPPYLHYQDLCGLPEKRNTPTTKPRKYIRGGIYLNTMIYKQITIFEWIYNLMSVDGFLYYFKEDKAPFYRQFTYKF